ncbi:hypothetical protein U1Q18_003122 [Sarracenia purpurea var. burkii]
MSTKGLGWQQVECGTHDSLCSPALGSENLLPRVPLSHPPLLPFRAIIALPPSHENICHVNPVLGMILIWPNIS